MCELITPSSHYRLTLPESVLLEPEHFIQASILSRSIRDCGQQWQAYLTALAYQGVIQWLEHRAPTLKIELKLDSQAGSYLVIRSLFDSYPFTVGIVATEEVLSGFLAIPEALINIPVQFCLCTEVSTEQEEVSILGFVSQEKLLPLIQAKQSSSVLDKNITLPLTLLDAEPDHLLHYFRYTRPALNTTSVNPSTAIDSSDHPDFATHLLDWLGGRVSNGWQNLAELLNTESQLSLSTRNVSLEQSRCKLIELGPDQTKVAMILSVVSEPDEKLKVSVQLHPTGKQYELPEDISLQLYSTDGENLQTVFTEHQDNFVQLRPFKLPPLVTFGLSLTYFEMTWKETFVL